MPDPNVLVSGETLIDFLPERPGPLSDVPSFARRPGGAPANVAVALARLEETPWFWTRLAEDPFGDFLAETLDERGVPDRFVERDPAAQTTLAFVTHDETGDREFSFYRDDTADTRLEPGGVPDEALDAVEWVYVGGVMLATEPARAATVDLAERARARDCEVVFDPNARPELWPTGGFEDAVAELLDVATVVKATPDDLRMAGFEAEEPERLAAAVADRGPHTVLLTLGGTGAFSHAEAEAPWGAESASHRGYDVTVRDTTGAGDAFTAGAVAAFAAEDDRSDVSLSDVLAFANAVAARTTTEDGAMAALPDHAAAARLRDS